MEPKSVVQKTPNTGFDSVRAKAHQQKEVRLKKAESADTMQARNSLQKIKTLKQKSLEENLPKKPSEPWLLTQVWGKFQEMIGNR